MPEVEPVVPVKTDDFQPVPKDKWFEILVPLTRDKYQDATDWPLLWVDGFRAWEVYGAHPASKVSVGGDLHISMLLKSRSHAKQLLHILNNHPQPDTWAIVPGKAVMQDQDLHHTLSPFLSHIDLQYIGVAHEQACSSEELRAWLDPSFAPPRLTRQNIAEVLLDYMRFPPLKRASAEPPPLWDMVQLSFGMDMVEDTLSHSSSRIVQRFLLIVLAWVAVHKARDTPKPYSRYGQPTWRQNPLCLPSLGLFGPHWTCKPVERQSCKTGMKRCPTQRLGSGW
jgi:hypothetical protein